MNPVISLPTLNEVIAIAFKRKFVLLFVVLLPIAVLTAAAFILPPKFQADSKVLVQSGREYMPRTELSGGGTEIGPQTTMLDTVNTEIEILTSEDLLRQVLHKQTIAKLYPDLIGNALLEDKAAKAFRADLAVAPVKVSNVIGVSLRSRSPELAVQTLDLLLAGFQQRHVEAFRRDRSTLLDKQLRENRAQMHELEKQRAEYRVEMGLHSPGEQRTVMIQQRAKDLQELQDMEIKKQVLTEQVAFLVNALKSQPDQIVTGKETHESDVAQDNQKRLRDLEQKERELRTHYLPGSPMLASIEASLASMRQFVTKTSPTSGSVQVGVNPIALTLTSQRITTDAELTTLANKIATLRAALLRVDANLDSLDQREVRLTDLDRQISQLTAVSNSERQKLEDANYLDDLDRAKVASITVIQQPVAPSSQPVFPKKSLFILAGAVIGLFAAGLSLLISFTFGVRVLVAETVERIIGLPVVATLPAVPPERMRRLVTLEPTNTSVTSLAG